MERLQKLIANAGVCSRRAAEKLILAGRVTVNGRVVTELGSGAEPSDEVAVDGDVITVPKRHRYVALHKPAGVVTTRKDPEGRETVYDLLYAEDVALHPVGRLDRDSTGLLLLTNDGELTHRLTHPRYGVEKVYQVWTRPWPQKAMLAKLRRGVELEDGPAVPKAARIAAPDSYEVTVAEGRNREVRRIFEALGLEILLLRRVRIGPIGLGHLKEGKARPLRPDEVDRLRELVGLRAPG
ncbi:MAG: rRNA pseudouridine synthase [Armatimonadetes bacterium]|nr:rRNA pseudouridine synthase [Armatimonadota bacterium]